MKKEERIETEQDLVGLFIEQSVGLYVKQKSNVHHGMAGSNDEAMEWLTEDLGNFLDGLSKDHGQFSETINTLRENLDSFVTALDQDLEQRRNAHLTNEKTLNPNGLALDNALMKVAPQSEFAKVGAALQGRGEMKDSGWKKVADLCRKCKLNKLSKYFDKKNQQAKDKSMKATLGKISQKLRDSKLVRDVSKSSSSVPKVKGGAKQKGGMGR